MIGIFADGMAPTLIGNGGFLMAPQRKIIL